MRVRWYSSQASSVSVAPVDSEVDRKATWEESGLPTYQADDGAEMCCGGRPDPTGPDPTELDPTLWSARGDDPPPLPGIILYWLLSLALSPAPPRTAGTGSTHRNVS